MVSFSNGKINVGLYVTNKRADGYHDIESLFFPIALSDAVELIPSSENQVTILNQSIPGNSNENSCIKALELMQNRFSIGHYHIFLIKHIPIGAGLGGGSSNASTVIKMINELAQLKLSIYEMESLALEIGSDNPFFIENKAKLATGRGEVLEPSPINLTNYKVVLINPNIHQSTVKAFSTIKVTPAQINLRHLELSHLLNQSTKVSNAFQEQFINEFPETSLILDELKIGGAFYSSLSGSGSTFFGLFTPNQEIPKHISEFAEANSYTYIETKIL